MSDSGKDGHWDATWEANRRRQLTIGLDATPAQRLAWLEEAILLAYETGALPRRQAKEPDRA